MKKIMIALLAMVFAVSMISAAPKAVKSKAKAVPTMAATAVPTPVPTATPTFFQKISNKIKKIFGGK